MDDLRLIEDYLPIEAISAEASREKSVRKGHISTLHLWWARRPLVACRAAVYGALVPADRWVKDIDMKNPPADPAKAEATKNGKKKGLNRKAAKDFVTKLCRYPKTDPKAEKDIKIKEETERAIVEAQRHILEAHADRLTAELAEAKVTGKATAWVEEFKFRGDKVSYDDIVAGRAPRPRVLDMFAGGGAIPLEALRLGCEAYALDLNPVAHIIQLCTLVYPQKYGKPEPDVRGMTGPKNANGETTWGGLAAEVRYWGNWVLDRVRKEIGDLYPPIPNPEVWDTPPEFAFDHETGRWSITKPGKPKKGIEIESASATGETAKMFDDEDDEEEDGSSPPAVQLPPGFLQPVAYLWTRTVRCKNPGCGAEVPMVKGTWLCRKKGKAVALKACLNQDARRVRYHVVQAGSARDIGFDPTTTSAGGNVVCPFCSTVADAEYIQGEGLEKRTGVQLLAIVALQHGRTGKIYIGADDVSQPAMPDSRSMHGRLTRMAQTMGLVPPDEPISPIRPSPNARGLSAVTRHGFTRFQDLFSTRQLLAILTLISSIRSQISKSAKHDCDRALACYLTFALDKVLTRFSTFSPWDSGYEKIVLIFGKHMLPMVWDFAEAVPCNGGSGSWTGAMENIIDVIRANAHGLTNASVWRGSATSVCLSDATVDAIITDPPYYDNIPYADIADFFYVWMKQAIGNLFPEHFANSTTPKRNEATALSARHDGDMIRATIEYEDLIFRALNEASRILKPGCPLCLVYAHKTTLGWATLADALRRAGFEVVEAWPMDTEYSGHLKIDTASLASSIVIVARKRNAGIGIGSYEGKIQPELQQIVRERVETLWDMGIAGADLVIACVGAGLRAFTKYEKVEYANGEEVPAEKFLAEVEAVVLDTMLAKLSGATGGNVSAVDSASRFYVLWRYIYRTTELDAGEAIVFSNGTHIELDGPHGLSAGRDALIEKKKAKYQARDFTERGDHDKLGLPDGDGQPAPLIDVLHRVLWLMENSPRKLAEFLDEARPDRERLRVLAQALAGAALSGKSEADAAKLVTTTAAEQATLGKLLANWRSLIEEGVAAAVVGKKAAKQDKEDKQRMIDFGREKG